MHLVRGSTADDSLSCSSVVGVLLGAAIVNEVMPTGGLASHPKSTCDLGVQGTPNGGSDGLGNDGSSALGGDGSMGRYCGGGVVALGLLPRGRRCCRCAGVQHGGTQQGAALRFPTRSHRIKWRIKSCIALVRGSVILTELFFLPLFSPVMFSSSFTQRLEH
jgi:hypothetical protein